MKKSLARFSLVAALVSAFVGVGCVGDATEPSPVGAAGASAIDSRVEPQTTAITTTTIAAGNGVAKVTPVIERIGVAELPALRARTTQVDPGDGDDPHASGPGPHPWAPPVTAPTSTTSDSDPTTPH